jgi:hypothetical protein
MKIIERIYNAETDKTTDVERDMTEQELVDHEIALKKSQALAAKEAEALAAKEAAQAKLAALGLTTDDLKALGL